jgi:hypothetical protein
MVLYNFYRNAVFVMMLFWWVYQSVFVWSSICQDPHILQFHLLGSMPSHQWITYDSPLCCIRCNFLYENIDHIT